MRRTLVTAGSFVLLLGAATTSASAHQGTGDDRGRSDDRAVILGGLHHPGQLSWDDDTLLVTQAGSGGNCTAPTTATGSTSARATSDDGTADQGSGDVPATPTTGTATPTTGTATSDDGTADQGSGDVPATPTTGTATPTTGTATPTDGATGTATDATEICSGTTGSVIAVKQPARGRGRAAPVADPLPSTLLSDGSVLGPTGAATGEGGVLLVAVGDRTPAAGSSGADA